MAKKIFSFLILSCLLLGCTTSEMRQHDAPHNISLAQSIQKRNVADDYASTNWKKIEIETKGKSYKYCWPDDKNDPYDQDNPLIKVISTAISNVKANEVKKVGPLKDGAGTYCYRGVKHALLSGDIPGSHELVGNWEDNIFACNALTTMKNHNFREIPYYVANPDKAPDGAIFVYKQDKDTVTCDDAHAGHIEIKYTECAKPLKGELVGKPLRTLYASYDVNHFRITEHPDIDPKKKRVLEAVFFPFNFLLPEQDEAAIAAFDNKPKLTPNNRRPQLPAQQITPSPDASWYSYTAYSNSVTQKVLTQIANADESQDRNFQHFSESTFEASAEMLNWPEDINEEDKQRSVKCLKLARELAYNITGASQWITTHNKPTSHNTYSLLQFFEDTIKVVEKLDINLCAYPLKEEEDYIGVKKTYPALYQNLKLLSYQTMTTPWVNTGKIENWAVEAQKNASSVFNDVLERNMPPK